MVAGTFRDMHRIRPFENQGREPKMVRALLGDRNAWPQLAAHAWARDRGRPAGMSLASSSALMGIECRILPQTVMRNMHFAIFRFPDLTPVLVKLKLVKFHPISPVHIERLHILLDV